MRNGASLSTKQAQFINPIFRKRDESWKYVHGPMTSTKRLTARLIGLLYRRKLAMINLQKNKLGYLASPQCESAHWNSYGRIKRGMEGNLTPSAVSNDSGYGDVYNKREVQEAHRFRDRRWDRGHHDNRHPWKLWWYRISKLWIFASYVFWFVPINRFH